MQGNFPPPPPQPDMYGEPGAMPYPTTQYPPPGPPAGPGGPPPMQDGPPDMSDPFGAPPAGPPGEQPYNNDFPPDKPMGVPGPGMDQPLDSRIQMDNGMPPPIHGDVPPQVLPHLKAWQPMWMSPLLSKILIGLSMTLSLLGMVMEFGLTFQDASSYMNRDKDAAVVRSSSKESEWGPIRRSFPPPAHDSLPANRVARRYVSSTPSMHAHLQARDYFPLTAVPTQAGGIVFLTLLHLIYAGTFMMLMWMDYKRFVGKPRNSIIGGFRTQMVVGGMQVILALDMLSRGISKLVQAGAYSLFALGLPNLAFGYWAARKTLQPGNAANGPMMDSAPPMMIDAAGPPMMGGDGGPPPGEYGPDPGGPGDHPPPPMSPGQDMGPGIGPDGQPFPPGSGPNPGPGLPFPMPEHHQPPTRRRKHRRDRSRSHSTYSFDSRRSGPDDADSYHVQSPRQAPHPGAGPNGGPPLALMPAAAPPPYPTHPNMPQPYPPSGPYNNAQSPPLGSLGQGGRSPISLYNPKLQDVRMRKKKMYRGQGRKRRGERRDVVSRDYGAFVRAAPRVERRQGELGWQSESDSENEEEHLATGEAAGKDGFAKRARQWRSLQRSGD